MVAAVFKRKRKGWESRSFFGRYSIGPGSPVRYVCLHTPDKLIAEKRLHDLVIEAQRESEGIVAPRRVRDTAAALLATLLSEYKADMRGRELAANHIKDSTRRIVRIVKECGWRRLCDVTSESFVAWRAEQNVAAKTKHEYQTSLNAFLNWLVRGDRLAANPLGKVDTVKRQGKQVRLSRAFTAEEFGALIKVAPANRRLVYLLLVYTGLRKREARELSWDGVDLEKGVATVLGKGGKSRVIPLRPELVKMLNCEVLREGERVIPVFPSDDALQGDLRRAGIERKNAAGKVLHWHAFRKTFTTWAASAGVGLRSAQAVLGHSTPNLTANVYTDVEALPLKKEVSRMPWLGEQVLRFGTQEASKEPISDRMRKLLIELVTVSESALNEGFREDSGAEILAARHGFEPWGKMPLCA